MNSDDTAMFRFWLERPLPAEFAPMLGRDACVIGNATETPDDPLSKLREAHAAIASSRIRYGAGFMDRAPSLRVISRTGMGYDNIDVAEATARGIAVCNAPDAPSRSTAEHTIAMILAVTKQLKRNDLTLSRGERFDFFNANNGINIEDKTLGLIGIGRIGGHVAKMARGLGMRVCAFDPHVKRHDVAEMLPTLEALLRVSDVVSLHVPLLPATRHMIDAAAIGQMKPGSYLVNCSRGGLIDEQALLGALKSGKIRGAGLDVFEDEPPSADHPLLRCDNVVATPHIAAATEQGKRRLWQDAITQALSVLRGQMPPHLVNPEVWDARVVAETR
jgi:D-3-phosphoglycerate dehydrogenase